MKQPRIEDLDPDLVEDEGSEESTLDATDDAPYSDEFLDEFLAQDFQDDDDEATSYDVGDSDMYDGDSDAEFDRYFRNADSHSRARRHRGHRSWRDAFEFEPSDRPDWGYGRRPRR